jgi:hypothetical protein
VFFLRAPFIRDLSLFARARVQAALLPEVVPVQVYPELFSSAVGKGGSDDLVAIRSGDYYRVVHAGIPRLVTHRR